MHAAPETLLRAVEGKVWEWVIPSENLPEAKQRHLISGSIRRPDGLHLRVVSDAAPEHLAAPTSPTLEDAYLYFISKNRSAGNN